MVPYQCILPELYTICLSSNIQDHLILPLQDRLEEWRKISYQLDKDHAKEFKRVKHEIKKRSSDTLRLQKKAKKGGRGQQRTLDSALQDVNDRYLLLEESERQAVRKALIEERSRFCYFVSFITPVVVTSSLSSGCCCLTSLESELSVLQELAHLQEILESLGEQTQEPFALPPASEQVLLDIKSAGPDTFWNFQNKVYNVQSISVRYVGFKQPLYETWQTPPNSPPSLGSRKSSMCSISSLNSSSSGSTSSPSHRQPQLPVLRVPSISSQDSGFTSQDHLCTRLAATPPLPGSAPPPPGPASLDFSSPPNATWPNLQDTLQFERAAASILKSQHPRPHTISTGDYTFLTLSGGWKHSIIGTSVTVTILFSPISPRISDVDLLWWLAAYERAGHHPRPGLTSQTFQPPGESSDSGETLTSSSNSCDLDLQPPLPPHRTCQPQVPDKPSGLKKIPVPVIANNNGANGSLGLFEWPGHRGMMALHQYKDHVMTRPTVCPGQPGSTNPPIYANISASNFAGSESIYADKATFQKDLAVILAQNLHFNSALRCEPGTVVAGPSGTHTIGRQTATLGRKPPPPVRRSSSLSTPQSPAREDRPPWVAVPTSKAHTMTANERESLLSRLVAQQAQQTSCYATAGRTKRTSPATKVKSWLATRPPSAPRDMDSIKTSLMDQIRMGVSLRRVHTNDRSAPRLP
ncbi:hypothetical protein LAZ67_13002856 [Cordylochernes scorpioides]|uniref:IMD domain-containing protein n=1 Tax=Cordylochernes scorpioides TaxID=51811 RepID=A0ABY6L6R0_9ARAC|nr:hypothetical protein LAZ67_13002856 [Cordylochernes scorpioides]